MERGRDPSREAARYVNETRARARRLTCLERTAADTGRLSTTARIAMNTLERLPERALELASRVGDGLRDAVPDRAVKWVETGAALGALRTGTRVATRAVRRNPVIAVAAVAGAGLLWYAARRRAKREDSEAIDGTSRRIEAKRETSKRGNGQRAQRGRNTEQNEATT